MDESEFRQLLDLFPVVRSRDYHADFYSSRQSRSGPSEEVRHNFAIQCFQFSSCLPVSDIRICSQVNEWHDAWNTEDNRVTESWFMVIYHDRSILGKTKISCRAEVKLFKATTELKFFKNLQA
ncbi:UNVERIFIED_CONTAM: hypothetical protein Sradi_0238700 [Sesamum radiatum]|uniref:Uncharacterized protein n=1 Tax=Sesamum radiatum TaxID=300843 RepID=A0AAW2W1R2_SESRA